MLNVTTDNIIDPNYIKKIDTLSQRIQSLSGVKGVQSITHGPEDLESARKNPLWQRLLIGEGEKSTFVIAFISTDELTRLISEVEGIMAQEDNQWFDIHISGLPYIVEQIRPNLMQDMKLFTSGAIILSALMLFAVFRSALVVVGAVSVLAYLTSRPHNDLDLRLFLVPA